MFLSLGSGERGFRDRQTHAPNARSLGELVARRAHGRLCVAGGGEGVAQHAGERGHQTPGAGFSRGVGSPDTG